MSSLTFHEKINSLFDENIPFVQVTLVDTTGSAPQEPGAKMLVGHTGLYYGTVGGGKIESRALEEAQKLLDDPSTRSNIFFQWNLTTDIGMTCGGSVKLFFERFNTHAWPIYIFGAGHVAQALIRNLLKLDCRITCIDSRQDWLNKLPSSPQLSACNREQMPEFVNELPNNAFVILMTMGHSSDKPILLEMIRQSRHFPYIGVIGSHAKAAQLRKDIIQAGLSEHKKNDFYCPIGLPLGNNHPEEIAISITAQLLQVRDQIISGKSRIESSV